MYKVDFYINFAQFVMCAYEGKIPKSIRIDYFYDETYYYKLSPLGKTPKKNSKLNDIVQKGGRGVNSNHNKFSFLIVTWGEGGRFHIIFVTNCIICT